MQAAQLLMEELEEVTLQISFAEDLWLLVVARKPRKSWKLRCGSDQLKPFLLLGEEIWKLFEL